MEVLGGMVVLAFLLFLGAKIGFVTIRFHKRSDRPTTGTGGSGKNETPVVRK